MYLMRHGQPEFPGGIRRCIGRTEYPLSAAGRMQAEDLSEYFRERPVEYVYTSPLRRCRESARILSGGRYPVAARSGLAELDMGEWENVPLGQLHKELESEPVQGEGRVSGLKRFQSAVEQLLEKSKGDIAIVAHAGINCCFLASVQGTPLERSRGLPQPYGGISRILIDDQGSMRIAELGVMPKKAPGERECMEIWNHYRTPENVRLHSRAVCVLAVEIGRRLNEKGCGLDPELIRRAALLHDVARQRAGHAAEGARILRREGYPKLAEIVGKHHDLGILEEKTDLSDKRKPDEAEVVYLADKLVKATCTVSLEQRFAESRKRCEESENPKAALAAWERRFREADAVKRRIENYIASGKRA